jgi:hypothetical protein
MANNNCCPACGRAFRAARAVQVSSNADKSTMSDTEIRAYYAATAPIEDVRAFMRLTLPSDLIDRAATLLDDIHANGGRHSAVTRRQYGRLHQEWREWRDRVYRRLERRAA